MEKRLALNVSINYFCNQKCFFCVDNNKSFLNFLKNDIDKKVFDAISNWIGLYENIVFTSGEPTLNKNFWEYIKYAKKSAYKNISMISNWSTLNDENIRKRILDSWLDEIIISIHWLWILHDIMVWVKWRFDKLIKGLVKFIDENNKKVKISLSFVMTKQNYKFLSKYIYFFDKLWINQIIINTLRPEWYAWWENFKKYFFSYLDFILYINSLTEKEKNNINKLIKEKKLILVDILPCILKQSNLDISWIGNVELRITKSWENFSDNWSEMFDNNNTWKKYIKECFKCSEQNNCEWIYINYINAFWENWILAIK